MHHVSNQPIKAILFDFDGTISTLRHGWESIMEPMMVELIAGTKDAEPSIRSMVREYIDESTGIQTIYQMQWLADKVRAYRPCDGMSDDPWWYKNIYNQLILSMVHDRMKAIEDSSDCREQYLMKGSVRFLDSLQQKHIKVYVASGTDHPDVINESKALGVHQYFDLIKGAPLGEMDCSKEAVMKSLLEDSDLEGEDIAVIGDGKVEIALGRKKGARTIGIASDEEKRWGINLVKERRLRNAGADLIVGDFLDMDLINTYLGL